MFGRVCSPGKSKSRATQARRQRPGENANHQHSASAASGERTTGAICLLTAFPGQCSWLEWRGVSVVPPRRSRYTPGGRLEQRKRCFLIHGNRLPFAGLVFFPYGQFCTARQCLNVRGTRRREAKRAKKWNSSITDYRSLVLFPSLGFVAYTTVEVVCVLFVRTPAWKQFVWERKTEASVRWLQCMCRVVIMCEALE